MGITDVGLSHVGLNVADLDRSIDFYRRYADMEVVHRRADHEGHGIAWLSDLTRPFVIVLLESPTVTHQLGGSAHLGVGCVSRDEVDHRLVSATGEGFSVVGPCDDGPPVGYWGLIVDPDGHNLELAYGQEVGLVVQEARPVR
ncbi:MAG TPA: VOC family protein [Microthrixaceae bacterium]|nr:VOC family protein [Microthrixaceae bacterium]